MITGHHDYTIGVRWDGNLGSGTSGYRDYSRELTVSADGKHELEGSADKPFRGDPSRWNPEELLLAALAQCHLLAYLHVAVTLGVVVTGYTDDAVGTMVEDGAGGGAFTEVILRPRVSVGEASMVEAALAAHTKANQLCFIANSVNFPVRHEPTIVVDEVA
ncbi:MAG TPA: OsmC family protein [Plantibacter sp.]|uniref:OsmC family protein n=1 Tax=unclassified Plantibacter TaxID=2624265 RepID=UPI002CBE9BDF|nr:OsmC family protein [Plantibacter sp.]